ncbi:alpha/beta fold hydrolase [Streptomyces sp. NPDC004111]|uniref:alpha/beta fold hydrolase n=1 Tax=Streptomyces sp. NPDC004111 TaxID=3364690 RepID=UPI00368A05F6
MNETSGRRPGSSADPATAPDLFTFEADGGPLVYRDTGDPEQSCGRPPVVLLHGGFLDHRMWDDQVPALARHHRVIAPDARGHGGSALAHGPYRPADDVAALLRHLGTGPAALVGVSMGGATAVDTALEHPDLVRGLVVSGVGTSEPVWRDPWILDIQAEQMRAMGAGDPGAWIEAFLQFLPGPHRSLYEVDPEVVRRVREMTVRTVSRHSADEVPQLVPVTDTWARAAALAVPVFALNGALDSTDHQGMAQRLADSVADGSTAEVAGTGHYPNMERPEVFNVLLEDFLRSL